VGGHYPRSQSGHSRDAQGAGLGRIPIGNLSPLGTEVGVLDVLAMAFGREVNHLARRGLHRQYVVFEDELPYIRGRLLIGETARRSRGLEHRPTSRYTELTPDNRHNQVLLFATTLLAKFLYTTRIVPQMLASNLAMLSDVSSIWVSASDVDTLPRNRLNAHYDRALALARLILDHLTFQFSGGGTQAPSFLVNMDDTYEAYVRQLISEQASMLGLSAHNGARLFLDVDNEIRIKPDLVVYQLDGTPVAAFDAKYKRDAPEPDVYQALAYAEGLGLRRVTLVYPEEGGVDASAVRARSSGIEIRVRTLPVGKRDEEFRDLDKRAAHAARNLIVEALS
jgi:5-methylcytosine-specific restriction enzyme subunit McrC